MITNVNENSSQEEFNEFIDNAFIAMCQSRNKVKHTVEYDDEKQEIIFHYTDGTADRISINTVEEYQPKRKFVEVPGGVIY